MTTPPDVEYVANGPVCGCCGKPTIPPTPGTAEEGFYCETCGAAWDDPTAVPPKSCLLYRNGDHV